MANSAETSREVHRSSTWWLRGRTVLLLFLLSLELLSFSLIYDLQPLQQNAVLILCVAGYVTAIFRIFAVAIVALAVIERRSVAPTIRRWADLASNDRAFRWKLAGHVIAGACFALVSSQVLRANGIHATHAGAWLWTVTGGLALACWLAALAPIRFLAEFCRSLKPSVVALCWLIGVGVYLLMLVADSLWFPLNNLTLAASDRLLRLFSSDVVFNSAARILGTSRFKVEVAPVCSGLEGIVLVGAALSLFLILFRNALRFPHALLVVPIGIVTIWVCNAFRIVALILIGTHISPNIALGGFHSQAGWIGFAGVTLFLAFVALRSPFFARETRPTANNSITTNPAAAYLMPLLAMIAAAMVAAALSSGFDTLYPLKILAGLGAMACFVSVYRNIPWSWSWLAAINGVVVFAFWIGLERFSAGDGTQLAARLHQLPPGWALVWLAVRAIGSTIVVPLAEELAFRGFLMRRITTADFDTISYRQASWLSVLVSSLLFGLLHGRWFAGALAGTCYALATRRRNMLYDAVTAHAVTNGLIAIYVLATGSWQLWA